MEKIDFVPPFSIYYLNIDNSLYLLYNNRRNAVDYINNLSAIINNTIIFILELHCNNLYNIV